MISSNKATPVLIVAAIVVGLLGAAAILGRSISDSRNGDRFVTVRGLSEKDVKADLAIWPIKVRFAGDNLVEANRVADDARKKVISFLNENGLPPDAIASQNIRVSDRQSNEYAQQKSALRYMVEYTILLRSKDVDKVQKVSQMTDKLVSAGVVLSSQGNWDKNSPQFLFTQLNSIKPQMLAEATRSAREVATQLAADSSSQVGAIRRASQGLFTISDRDQVASRDGGEGEGAVSSGSDPNKRVRVVVTVDYFLK